jgi:hypothetical protein
MNASTDQLLSLLNLILPAEILEYFTIVNIEIRPQEVHLFLDEKNSAPQEFKHEKLISKGFYPESVIQDFPLRDKPLNLYVRRRKWVVESTGKVVSKTWKLTADGTRYSKEFASFLKELLGFLPS